MKLDPFYPILDSAGWLDRLLPLGIKMVQLRIKNLGQSALRQEIARAKEIARRHDCLLIINDYWQLAIDLDCEFVHLGQEDLDGADIDAIRTAGIALGISTHSPDELERALLLKPDYIALGPVYPTILKKMKWKQQGLPRVTEWKKLIGKIPLVAIGGMTVERAAGVFEAGADVVSMVTDITLNPDPELRTRQWLAATGQDH